MFPFLEKIGKKLYKNSIDELEGTVKCIYLGEFLLISILEKIGNKCKKIPRLLDVGC